MDGRTDRQAGGWTEGRMGEWTGLDGGWVPGSVDVRSQAAL